MEPPAPSEDRSAVERALLEFLIANPGATEAEFEAYCREHPDEAAEMRRLFESWMAVETLVGDASIGVSWLSRMVMKWGEIDPGVTLASEAPGPSPADTNILSRLSKGGRPVQRYQNRELLARGGMGEVLKVWDNDLRRFLAMKVIREGPQGSDTPDREVLGRFLEEAQVTGQLDHPSIVPVHELGMDPTGDVFFTMRLVRGDDFKKILPRIESGEDGWSVTRALNVLLRACEAMAFAHSKGVFHRDLKPANIMVGRFGEVYVMDWGLARVLSREDRRNLRVKSGQPDEPSMMRSSRIETDRAKARDSSPDEALVTMDGTVVGTPCYMPPEQALGESQSLGPRSDVYSLGAILYHVLTGTMPYVPKGKNVSPHLVLMALIHGPPRSVQELAPDAPAELVAICEKAMAHDPADRYASAVELKADIQAYLEHRPVAARQHSLREVARLAYERNKPVALTAASAAVILLVSATVFVLGLQSTLKQRNVALSQAEELTVVLQSRTLLQDHDQLSLTPKTLDQTAAWLASVRSLLEHRPDLERERDDPATRPARRASIERALDRFDQLAAREPRVIQWEQVARSLEGRIDGEDSRDWANAIAAIDGSFRYGDFQLAPQVGLAPLREDPVTGLWEFWHIASGTRPEVDPKRPDRYRLSSETGIVLVLLPENPGFVAGDDTGELNYIGTFEFDVPAVFAGKYEVTQGQWTRVMDRNDSIYTSGLEMPAEYANERGPQVMTDLHPVEGVTWYRAQEFVRRLGLELPSEVYWENLCRGETETRWCWGDLVSDLRGKENLSDLEAINALLADPRRVDWNDGFALTAPVGSFEPNPYGLFDVHGNVSEWCRSLQKPDDFWLARDRDRAFVRGGSWMSQANMARSGTRYHREANEIQPWIGLRVILSIEK